MKGVRIVSFDLAHCALFHAFLEASKIEEYKCNKQYTIGISLVNLFKLLKNVTVNDELELRLDDANLDVLQITILNRVKNTRWTYEMKLMDIDEEMIEIPEKEYMTCITMVSSEFQKICRDISIVADKAELPKTEPPKTEVVVSDPDPPKTDADVNMEDSGGDSDDSGKKRKRAPIMSTSIPDMSVGDVRKTLNELRKLGASATVDHKLHNGWTAGDFCLKYVLGSYTPQ
eukprot:jgi/Mesvir1/20408/Mv12312-RA.1